MDDDDDENLADPFDKAAYAAAQLLDDEEDDETLPTPSELKGERRRQRKLDALMGEKISVDDPHFAEKAQRRRALLEAEHKAVGPANERFIAPDAGEAGYSTPVAPKRPTVIVPTRRLRAKTFKKLP